MKHQKCPICHRTLSPTITGRRYWCANPKCSFRHFVLKPEKKERRGNKKGWRKK